MAEAAVAAAIAFALARRRTTPTRVLAAIVIGVGALGLATSPPSLARSACACTSPAIRFVPPLWLGLDATTWATMALVGVPALLAIALLPWRR